MLGIICRFKWNKLLFILNFSRNKIKSVESLLKYDILQRVSGECYEAV
jgi:hypothetical protein